MAITYRPGDAPAVDPRRPREKVMAETMTDEQYGRSWAVMMGKRPHQDVPGGVWYWLYAGHAFSEAKYCRLPAAVMKLAYRADGPDCMYWFRSDAGAYAALGRAVRRIHAAVPRLDGES